MRIFTSALSTETNTFSESKTTLQSFEELGIVRGKIAADALNGVGAIVEEWRRRAQGHGDELLEGIYAIAQPAGRVDADTYARLRKELIERIGAAMPLDIVLLFLHGAMAADEVDDCEGDLLRAVREVVGSHCIVGVELDPHCHLTAAMMKNADAIIAMREYPHTDFVERAADLFRICRGAASGTLRPVMAAVDCRMVGFYPTTAQPMRGLVDGMVDLERRPSVLSASFMHGFPWGDVPESGSKALVLTDGDERLAWDTATELAKRFYRERHQLSTRLETVESALQHVFDAAGPLILADVGDNPGGGAPGDHTAMLSALLKRQDLRSAVGMLCDPDAVDECISAGIGARKRLKVGGNSGHFSGEAIYLDAVIIATADDHCQHLSTGTDHLGRAAWVRSGRVDIVLISRRQQTLSPTAFTGLGVPIHEAQVIGVKSSHHYFAEFSKLSPNCRRVETGAALSMDFANLPYRRRARNYFPAIEDPAPDLQ